MTYWIYNMGLPVPVRDDRLLVKREVKPLSELTPTRKVANKENKTHQGLNDNTTQTNTHTNFLNSTYQDNTKGSRKLVYFAYEIMSQPVITLSDKASYYEAWQKFQRHKFHHFPISNEDGQLLGIVSDRDMLSHAALHNKNIENIHPITALMSKSVVTASPNTSIREICQIMFSQYLGAMPITNHKKDLLGIITRSDILKTMIKNGPIELWV